ncbi:MAG: transcriptional repressor [Faecalibacterium sp.]
MPRSGGYATKTRQLILEYLIINRSRTVSVNDILHYLGTECGEEVPNITTIYRYLDKLCAEHRVMKYAGEKGEKAVYQFMEDGEGCEHHLHLKCSTCGQVLHMNCGFMEEVRGHLMQSHGFALHCGGSLLYGTCSKCAHKVDK